MQQPLWAPSAERIAATRMDAFRRFVNQRHTLQLADYPALHAWSVAQRETFWQAIVDFFEVRFTQQPDAVLREGPAMPSAQVSFMMPSWSIASSFAKSLPSAANCCAPRITTTTATAAGTRSAATTPAPSWAARST